MFVLKYIRGYIAIEEVKIPVENLPHNLRGLKIVHLTDFHWDHKPIRITSQMMDDIVNRTNSIEPDLILLTGDYVQFEPEPIHKLTQNWLSKLKSKYGTYAVLGNHDYKTKESQKIITLALENVGIRVLNNEAITIEGLNDLELVGVGDFYYNFSPDKALPDPKMDHNKIRICLSHNPDSSTLLSQWRVNLTVCGHTHGGQIALPSIGPLIPFITQYIPEFVMSRLPRKIRSILLGTVKNWDHAVGLHKIPQKSPLNGYNYLYTSRGLATHPPMRLFCDPEIAVLKLVSS